MTTRTVTVMDRSQPWYPKAVAVTVEWTCPKCGGPRGEPHGHNQGEDGEWFHVHVWENPCGHMDYYGVVLEEANGKSPPTTRAGGDDR